MEEKTFIDTTRNELILNNNRNSKNGVTKTILLKNTFGFILDNKNNNSAKTRTPDNINLLFVIKAKINNIKENILMNLITLSSFFINKEKRCCYCETN